MIVTAKTSEPETTPDRHKTLQHQHWSNECSGDQSEHWSNECSNDQDKHWSDEHLSVFYDI